MSGVVNPGWRKQTSALDVVVAAANIARDLYGIKVNHDEAKAKQAERDDTAAEKKRFREGKLNKGEQLKMKADGFIDAKQGDAGAIPFTDADSGVTGYVRKQQQTELRPPESKVVNDAIFERDQTGKWNQVAIAPPKVKAGGGGEGGGGGALGKPPPVRDINGRTHQWDGKTWVPVEGQPKDITVNERNRLQADYDRDPEVRKAKTVLQSWGDARAILSEPSPAADLSLVYAYMKALDPGSVVRESEAETAAAIGGLQERAKAKLQNITGGGQLTDRQRADLARQIEKLARNAATGLDKLEGQFREHAGRRSVDVQDLRFSTRPEFTQDAPPPPAGSGGPQATGAAGKPSVGAVVEIQGKRYKVLDEEGNLEELR